MIKQQEINRILIILYHIIVFTYTVHKLNNVTNCIEFKLEM